MPAHLCLSEQFVVARISLDIMQYETNFVLLENIQAELLLNIAKCNKYISFFYYFKII